MSDRELRDELEQLYGEVGALEKELAVPDSEHLAHERTRLLSERDAERAAVTTLEQQLGKLRALITEREEALPRLEASLQAAREKIGALEPLGDPLAESRSNWETNLPRGPSGCAFMVWAVTGVGVALAGWWR